MKNLNNIKLVLDKIESNPACWDQMKWHCGTSHCFFGHGQIEAGKKINDDKAGLDGKLFFGFTAREARYYAECNRTFKELKTALYDFFDKNGYDPDGLDENGFDEYGLNEYGYKNQVV